MLGAACFRWRMDNLWHMMPRSDASPPKTQAPHERIRTTAKAKETDLKKVMVRLRYFWSVEKMAKLLEIWVPFFLALLHRDTNGFKFNCWLQVHNSDLQNHWPPLAMPCRAPKNLQPKPYRTRPWILWVFVCRSSDFNHLKNEVFRWLNGWWVV